MKIIVTHHSPDLDAVGAVWAIKRFLPGWEEAKVKFVPAGERIQLSVLGSRLSVSSQSVVGQSVTDKQMTDKQRSENRKQKTENRNPIDKIDGDEVIHVDTGLGPLDHHQTDDEDTCAAKRAWEWVIKNQKSKIKNRKLETEAGDRLMEMICQIDHFKEVFWPDSVSDRYDITVSRILDGLKLLDQDDDRKIVDVGLICLDSLYRAFQNKVWAEEELQEKGVEFTTRFGKGIGVETLNDDVIHLSQRMGYQVAVRKDPRKGYVRIKASPLSTSNNKQLTINNNIDLTPVYEKLRKLDSQATWFLHVSKRMLLNGTTKNPKMRPTKLTLAEIIEVLKNI